MHRPTRTRRLSIAAIVSLLLFIVVAGAGVRSFWVRDEWDSKPLRQIILEGGHVGYTQTWGKWIISYGIQGGHHSSKAAWANSSSALKFYLDNIDSFPDYPGALREFQIFIPLWPVLLLLLIAPVRWLIAQPANAPAFPVITNE